MVVTVNKDTLGRITVSFYYKPLLVQKVKAIDGHRWHPDKKHWSFPTSNGILEKILELFKGEEIHLDPALQAEISGSPIRQNPSLAKPSPQSPSLVKRGEGRFSDKKTPYTTFEDIRKELVSRKYSYRTVKGYLYYNREFVNFIKKNPHDITETDIKDYLLYLAEEKQSATATLNQAINALKFYYGTMLKKKFVYEVKRPRKDKKLPVVLSQEEVANILSSVDNLKHRTILMLVYSAGLRVGEVVRLKPEDIDSKRMLIHLKGVKGRKDRYTLLSNSIRNF
jgi:integrase/recombinase XerD